MTAEGKHYTQYNKAVTSTTSNFFIKYLYLINSLIIRELNKLDQGLLQIFVTENIYG